MTRQIGSLVIFDTGRRFQAVERLVSKDVNGVSGCCGCAGKDEWQLCKLLQPCGNHFHYDNDFIYQEIE